MRGHGGDFETSSWSSHRRKSMSSSNILIVLVQNTDKTPQKKKYKKLCFFFFIYLLVMKRKNKQKIFTKKSKKKSWNFIFYLYIECDHSGWSNKKRYENNRNIVHIYSERHTIPRFDCVSFYLWKILKW